MKTYTIPPCPAGAPDWDAGDWLHVDQVLWLPAAGIRMDAKLFYDSQAIYVYQRAVEPSIRAVHHEPFSMVCEDSCMEFFLRPSMEDPRFFNFEWNPNGCSFIGIETCCHDIVRLAPLDAAQLFQPQVRRFEGGWELRYRIPHAFVRMFFPQYRPGRGTQLGGNCYKCGDLTDQPHYLAWSPVHHPTPDFHQSKDFGLFTLG